jgi:DNA repair protein RAD5
MLQLEKGSSSQDAATTLHPCWEAYKLEDKYVCVVLLYELFLVIMVAIAEH